MEKKNITFYDRIHYSLRLGGWSKIFFPTFLGQVIASKIDGQLNPVFGSSGVVLAFLTLMMILFLNDLADEKVDHIKRRLHEKDSSPKTLPDGLIPKKAVLFLAFIFSVSLVAFGAFVEFFLDRPYFTAFAFCIFLFNFSYSFWPLKLNYRFGGEFLEGIGTGIFLPFCNAYLQSGVLYHPSYLIFGSFFFLALASALCSGVCDRISDLEGGKKTFSVLIGNQNTVKFILVSLIFFPLSLSLLGFFMEAKWLPLSFLFLALTVFGTQKLLRYRHLQELEESIQLQKKFRQDLHTFLDVLSYPFLLLLLFLG